MWWWTRLARLEESIQAWAAKEVKVFVVRGCPKRGRHCQDEVDPDVEGFFDRMSAMLEAGAS